MSKKDDEALTHLAHNILILHLFHILNRFDRKQSKRDYMSRKKNEAARKAGINADTMAKAMAGSNIQDINTRQIADALDGMIHDVIKLCGGEEMILKELQDQIMLKGVVRRFSWLEERLSGKKPPYIRHGDMILNRNDRHLVDEYNISLAIGPCPGGEVDIQYAQKKEPAFPCNTLSYLKYSLVFSPHNRDHELDFALSYASDGRLELITPEASHLKDPASYRRSRTSFLLVPDPKISTPQHASALLFAGAYDQELVNTHFSFTQNALYRKISFTLDLSSYPQDAIVQEPKLMVICKLPGMEFDCCKMAATGEGQTIDPSEILGQRRVWKFESFEQMMIHISWKIDKSRLPEGVNVSRENLIALFPD